MGEHYYIEGEGHDGRIWFAWFVYGKGPPLIGFNLNQGEFTRLQTQLNEGLEEGLDRTRNAEFESERLGNDLVFR